MSRKSMPEIKKRVLKVVLRSYLDSVGVSAYLLAQWIPTVSPKTIYAVANGTRRPSLELVESILLALNENGYKTSIEDILKFENE